MKVDRNTGAFVKKVNGIKHTVHTIVPMSSTKYICGGISLDGYPYLCSINPGNLGKKPIVV